jgi:mRNA export factor
MRNFPKVAGPVTAVSFTRDGMALAYAVGYDWAKGYQHNKPDAVRKIVLHTFPEALKKDTTTTTDPKKKTGYW